MSLGVSWGAGVTQSADEAELSRIVEHLDRHPNRRQLFVRLARTGQLLIAETHNGLWRVDLADWAEGAAGRPASI